MLCRIVGIEFKGSAFFLQNFWLHCTVALCFLPQSPSTCRQPIMHRSILLGLCLVGIVLLTPAHIVPAPKPKKIVLIAGKLDPSHPPGTHEYENSVRLLKHCLDRASNLKDVVTEMHFNGWPEKVATLDDADTIVLISSGSDRQEKDHPFLIGDRLRTLEKQMQRGCGLAVIHWATFFPNNQAGEKALAWVGGHFDYQSGPPPQRWKSAIQNLTTTAKPATAGHPVCQGLSPFQVREEFYYRMRFREKENKFQPLLLAQIPGEKEEQIVAWSVERPDGGRGFGFTGGHYFANWWVPQFRKLVLNAIVWTAKGEVPANGVEAVPPPKELFEKPPEFSPDWTPRWPEGKHEPWEHYTDRDWVDGRFQQMNTGPFLNATVEYAHQGKRQLCFKGTAIRIGDKGEAAILFDRNQLCWAAAWTGDYLQHKATRYGLMNTPKPAGQILCSTPAVPGWRDPQKRQAPPATIPLPADWGKFKGLHLHGKRTVLEYTVGQTTILECPWIETVGNLTALSRTLEIGAGTDRLRMRVAHFPENITDLRQLDGVSLAVAEEQGIITAIGVVPSSTATVSLTLGNKTQVEIEFLPQKQVTRAKLLYWRGPSADLPKFAQMVKNSSAPEGLSPWLKPGPSRWQPLTTKGEVSPNHAAYVTDTLTIPYDNPWKALFFVTGVDFLPNGDVAVCTAHGDVWLISGVDDKLEKLTWRRFATGLYQPLGLKVVDGKIFVLERGQLTRLHDFNSDGEADFYECFNNDWHCAGGEHSYDFSLETDPQGNFYFHKTGDTQTPHGGCLMRISKDGKKLDVVCTGFRHPLGLGMSPTGIITGADQEGNWMPATRIDQYKPGGFYGDMRAHHREVPPKTYDPPLCWLPREMDNSAASQVWVTSDKFGPLQGHLLHFSYGRCRAMLLMRQMCGDLVQGGAVDLGWPTFLAGCARGRFRPQDGWLYVVGLNGWQTAAKKDGCLQRMRYTGGKLYLPLHLRVEKDAINLTFSQRLDPSTATATSRYFAEQWNYRWSREYGSRRWSVANPNQQGQDRVPIRAVTLLPDQCTVKLHIPGLQPVMQMEISYRVQAADGQEIKGVLYQTINKVPEQGE
jgi:type 1 glutamine amidotransferase